YDASKIYRWYVVDKLSGQVTQITKKFGIGGNRRRIAGVVPIRRGRSASAGLGGAVAAGNDLVFVFPGGLRGRFPCRGGCGSGNVPGARRARGASIPIMMGHTHALTGAIAWLGLAPPLAALPLLNETSRFVDTGVMATALTPAELIAGAIICAGAAMLPDLDHPSATIAQTFGPVTWLLSKAVSWLSGGHRGATHSLAFAVATGFGAHWLASAYPIGRDIMVVLLIGLSLRAIGIGIPRKKFASAMVNIGMTAGLYAVFLSLDVGYAWLGLVVGIGCL